jgi:hypothetical protein
MMACALAEMMHFTFLLTVCGAAALSAGRGVLPRRNQLALLKAAVRAFEPVTCEAASRDKNLFFVDGFDGHFHGRADLLYNKWYGVIY